VTGAITGLSGLPLRVLVIAAPGNLALSGQFAGLFEYRDGTATYFADRSGTLYRLVSGSLAPVADPPLSASSR